MNTKSKFFGYINKDKSFGIGVFVDWFEHQISGKTRRKLKNIGLAYGARVLGLEYFIK